MESTQARIARLRAELAELEAQEALDPSSPLGIFQSIGTTLYEKESLSEWVGKPLEKVNKLKPDTSGKVGELFLEKLCKMGELPCQYMENINSTDGTYDAIVCEKKVEIKTARIGVQRGFQHESLRADGCDYYLFIDVLPSAFYMTVLAKFDMTTRHPVIGRAPHLRKGTTDVYKFDFGETHLLQAAVRHGCSMKVEAATSLESVARFLRRMLV